MYVEDKPSETSPDSLEDIPPREAGDGHEEPDSVVNDTTDIDGKFLLFTINLIYLLLQGRVLKIYLWELDPFRTIFGIHY